MGMKGDVVVDVSILSELYGRLTPAMVLGTCCYSYGRSECLRLKLG